VQTWESSRRHLDQSPVMADKTRQQSVLISSKYSKIS
jgi:hypothetical protein